MRRWLGSEVGCWNSRGKLGKAGIQYSDLKDFDDVYSRHTILPELAAPWSVIASGLGSGAAFTEDLRNWSHPVSFWLRTALAGLVGRRKLRLLEAIPCIGGPLEQG